MHRSLLGTVVFATVGAFAASAMAQPPARPAAPPPPTCPAGGYAPPAFGTFGDNDGALRGYEIASPCIGKELRDASEAIGMGRYRPLGVKNVTTIRFQATGDVANDRGVVEKGQQVDVSISYVIPAMRAAMKTADGKGFKFVHVFADKTAWNETSPGVGGTPAPAALGQRAPLVKLTPFGALWSVIDAEGHATVKTAGGQTVVTGTSPYDGYPVSVTLNEKHLPVHVEVKADGRVYEADFSDYRDTWESPYLVIFPAHIVWRMNKRPLADLTVTAFHSNPYVIFPAPEPSATAKAK